MGYAGGTKANPTYRSLGDHTETLQLDFDPGKISYEELLVLFWDSHNPVSEPYSRQYMSIVFYHDQEQENQARRLKALREEALGQSLFTEIVPADGFYLAEDYHQKYYLQNNRVLIREMKAYYPDFQELVDSMAAARVNGYAAGYGSATALERDLPDLGLSSRAQNELVARVR